MNTKRIARASRKMSLVLRHKPETIGLTLDKNGWAEVSHLLKCLTATGTPLTREELEIVVSENNKKRFAFSPDGRKIRASQGHSIDVDLGLEAIEPPPRLFHGTAWSSVEAILNTGLEPRSRRHVHLSLDQATATQVGARHGKPVILVVDAAAMHAAGHKFYRSANDVWLSDGVPRAFLTLSKG